MSAIPAWMCRRPRRRSVELRIEWHPVFGWHERYIERPSPFLRRPSVSRGTVTG